MAEDELTPRAAELVMLTGKASTSMMQTKLKVGFNRASRLMEELERVGIVGPQDPRNPATPRQVYGPENWLRSTEDVDAPCRPTVAGDVPRARRRAPIGPGDSPRLPTADHWPDVVSLTSAVAPRHRRVPGHAQGTTARHDRPPADPRRPPPAW